MVDKRKFRRRKPPITLAPVSLTHERLAVDVPAHAQVAPVEVVDPYSHVEDTHIDAEGHASTGARIVVMRSLRDDPLGRLQAQNRISDAQFQAGRRWQAYYEQACRAGVQSVDTSKEPVDGGRFPDMVSDGQFKALTQLRLVEAELGALLSGVVRVILVDGLTVQQMAEQQGAQTRWQVQHWGFLFAKALDQLAVCFGLAGTAPARQRKMRVWQDAA